MSGSSEDSWGIVGSRPGSSASVFPPETPTSPATPIGYQQTSSHQFSQKATYKKPNKYNPRGNPGSGRVTPNAMNRTYSQDGFTPSTPKKSQNYFQSKAKSGTKPTYMTEHSVSGRQESDRDSPWGEGPQAKPRVWDNFANYQESRSQVNGSRPNSALNNHMDEDGRSTPSKSRNYYGKTWNKRNASYADDSLFGEKPDAPGFKSPWTKDDKKQYVFDATDYKAMEIKKQLQAAMKNSKNKTKAGPTRPNNDQVAKIENQVRSQLSVQGETARAHSRNGSTPRSQTPSTPKSQTKKKMFKESYVDELLFGSKQAEPEFPAPWEDSMPKAPRYHAFDGTNSTLTIHHDNSNGRAGSSRVSSRAGSRAGSRPGSARKSGSTSDLRAAWH